MTRRLDGNPAPRRTTRQRSAIAAALDRADGFRSAQEIYDDLRSRHERVGLTTVYRALQSLVAEGGVDILRTTDGEAVYRKCTSDEHHHHLVCRDCGRSVEIEGAEVETWSTRTAARHGFTAVTHTLEIFGLCRRCGA